MVSAYVRDLGKMASPIGPVNFDGKFRRSAWSRAVGNSRKRVEKSRGRFRRPQSNMTRPCSSTTRRCVALCKLIHAFEPFKASVNVGSPQAYPALDDLAARSILTVTTATRALPLRAELPLLQI